MRGRAVAVSLFLLALSRPSRADDKAAAAIHFDEGVALMEKREYEPACRKFKDSLDAYRGLGAMLWLADCYEKNGQTASAWTQFREAAAVAADRNDPREKVAREQIAGLEPHLSYLAVRVPNVAPGLVVRRDGVIVLESSWGLYVPVDPGPHVVTAAAPGRRVWETATAVPSGSRVEVVVTTVAFASAAGANDAAPSSTRRERDAGRTQKVAGVSVAAAGLVGLGVAGLFALRIQTKLDDSNADNHCRQPGDVCDRQGLALRAEAGDAATAATIASVLGGAALALGALLFFTAPSSARRTTVSF